MQRNLFICFILAGFTCAFFSAKAQAESRVERICTAAISLFRTTPEKSKTKIPQAVPDVFLSQGYSAQTFIARDPFNLHRVIVKKIYKSNELGDRRYHFDVEGLNALAGLAKEDDSFEFVRGERYMEPAQAQDETPRPAVRMPFIEGRTLHQILSDPGVSVEIKTKLTEIYSFKLELLRQALLASDLLSGEIKIKNEETRYFFDGIAVPLSMLNADLKSAGEILIKSDNIIVDPFDSNKMTIVDPY